MHATNVSLYNLNIANTYGKVRGVGGRSRPWPTVCACRRTLINVYWNVRAWLLPGSPAACRPGTCGGSTDTVLGRLFSLFTYRSSVELNSGCACAGAGDCTQRAGGPVRRVRVQHHWDAVRFYFCARACGGCCGLTDCPTETRCWRTSARASYAVPRRVSTGARLTRTGMVQQAVLREQLHRGPRRLCTSFRTVALPGPCSRSVTQIFGMRASSVQPAANFVLFFPVC